jgi:hypothetical protein
VVLVYHQSGTGHGSADGTANSDADDAEAKENVKPFSMLGSETVRRAL